MEQLLFFSLPHTLPKPDLSVSLPFVISPVGIAFVNHCVSLVLSCTTCCKTGSWGKFASESVTFRGRGCVLVCVGVCVCVGVRMCVKKESQKAFYVVIQRGTG